MQNKNKIIILIKAIEELANLPPTVELIIQGIQFTLQLESKSRSFLPGNEIKGKLKFDAPSGNQSKKHIYVWLVN
jgi:hypothetical protein